MFKVGDRFIFSNPVHKSWVGRTGRVTRLRSGYQRYVFVMMDDQNFYAGEASLDGLDLKLYDDTPFGRDLRAYIDKELNA